MANTIHPTTTIRLCGTYNTIRFLTIQKSTIMLYDCKKIAMLIMKCILEKKGGRKRNEEDKEARKQLSKA
jgi:hypothetical protein